MKVRTEKFYFIYRTPISADPNAKDGKPERMGGYRDADEARKIAARLSADDEKRSSKAMYEILHETL